MTAKEKEKRAKRKRERTTKKERFLFCFLLLTQNLFGKRQNEKRHNDAHLRLLPSVVVVVVVVVVFFLCVCVPTHTRTSLFLLLSIKKQLLLDAFFDQSKCSEKREWFAVRCSRLENHGWSLSLHTYYANIGRKVTINTSCWIIATNIIDSFHISPITEAFLWLDVFVDKNLLN